MALPKRRHSKARTRKRRAHDALTLPSYVNCSSCGALTKSHSVCSSCGTYKGTQIIKIKEKKK